MGNRVLQVSTLGKRYSSYPGPVARLKTLLGLHSHSQVYLSLIHI